jgi:hypothetical protein
MAVCVSQADHPAAWRRVASRQKREAHPHHHTHAYCCRGDVLSEYGLARWLTLRFDKTES